jgi:hypothetical protein
MEQLTFSELALGMPNLARTCKRCADQIRGQVNEERYIYTCACEHIYVKTDNAGIPYIMYGDNRIEFTH